MIRYDMFIKSVLKFGKEECKKYDLHVKHLHDCYRLSKVKCYEISVDGGNHTKTFDGPNYCINFTKHIRAVTAVRSPYLKEKERELLEHDVVMSVDMLKVIMVSWLPGLKQAIFCKRLLPFVETFAPVGSWKKSKMVKPTGIL